MIQSIATFEGRIAKVSGPARSGKTEALVRRAAHLLRAGCDGEDILVVVSSRFAASAFRGRLAATAGEELASEVAKVQVKSALEACVDVLATPEARAACGRAPRLLSRYEYNFILEDVKTTGEAPRQLKKMLAYFMRMLAAATPREEWDIGGKEDVVYDLMVRSLTMRGGMLPQEAPAYAMRYLESNEGKTARGAFPHVLADDFQNLTRAEQICVCLLAKDQLIVAGCAAEAVSGRAGEAYPEGFSSFDALRRNVSTFDLEKPHGNSEIAAYAEALIGPQSEEGKAGAQEAVAGENDPTASAAPNPDVQNTSSAHNPTPCGMMSVKWRTPDEELNGLTKIIRAIADAAGDDEARTCVIVPNRRWALMAKRVLESRGFAASAAGALGEIGGDPREEARARAIIAMTKLQLLADPTDMCAWRTWCGIGNHLANSDAWAHLQEYAEQKGMALYDALREIGEEAAGSEPFLRAQALVEKWRSGHAFIGENAARRGFDLLRAIGAEGLVEFEETSRAIAGDEDARTLLGIAWGNACDPTWPDNPHTIRIATANALAGQTYDRIFVMAAVDGFYPAREAFEVISTEEDRARAMGSEKRAFYAAVAKAGELLAVSHFATSPLELAEKSRMQVSRIRAQGDGRVAIVRPTCLLAQAGAGAPPTQGGDSLLAEYGLA